MATHLGRWPTNRVIPEPDVHRHFGAATSRPDRTLAEISYDTGRSTRPGTSGLHAPNKVEAALKMLCEVVVSLEQNATTRYGGLAVAP